MQPNSNPRTPESRSLGTLLFSALLTGALLSPAADGAQSSRGAAPKGSQGASAMETVRKRFKLLDADGSGSVSTAEMSSGKIRISAAIFSKHDSNKDKALDGDEFVFLYRDLLTRAKQPIPKELTAEVELIQGRRRARQEALRKEAAQKDAQKDDGKNAQGTAKKLDQSKVAPAKPPAPVVTKKSPAPASGKPSVPPDSANPVKVSAPTTPALVPSTSPATAGSQPAVAPIGVQPAPIPGRAPKGASPDDAERAKEVEAARALAARIQAARDKDAEERLQIRIRTARDQAMAEWRAANAEAKEAALTDAQKEALALRIKTARDQAMADWAAAERVRMAKMAEKKQEESKEAGKPGVTARRVPAAAGKTGSKAPSTPPAGRAPGGAKVPAQGSTRPGPKREPQASTKKAPARRPAPKPGEPAQAKPVPAKSTPAKSTPAKPTPAKPTPAKPTAGRPAAKVPVRQSKPGSKGQPVPKKPVETKLPPKVAPARANGEKSQRSPKGVR